MAKIRTYSDLRQLESIEKRYEYLKLTSQIGLSTFGFDRHINQAFYTSRVWRQLRHDIIARDAGCDLGIDGYQIHQGLYIHHMNPITLEQLVDADDNVLDPEYLITVSHRTHNAIHFGNVNLLPREPVVRRPGDTKLW